MKKIRNKIFIIFLSYGIMLISELVKGNSLTLREFDFDSKPIKAYTDAIKYHVKANGYEKKYKDEMENNFYKYTTGPGRELETERAKMQGYGNYVMKPDTSLYGFIEYCHIADSVRCDIASRYLDETNINYCNYEKLITYKNQVLSGMKTTHVNNFWTLMSSEEFNRYQDIYYYCYYTHKVVLRSGFSLSYLSEIRDRDKDGSKEFMTISTTYAYAIGKDSAINFTVERGDIIPFLYVKYRGTEENDSYVDDESLEKVKNNPYEIARYVYVALIEGWVENIDDNHLWEEEYEAVFGEAYRSDDLIASVDTLREWYTVAKEKYKRERGNKGNNLIGSNLDTIIESDYSISEQIEAVDYYLKNVVEISKYKETMARNELMAKYMMENSRINDIIKDYTVGINFITENLQRGTSRGKNTKSIVLSDFQVLEFDHTLNEKNKHSDDDGITDLEELTGKANGDIEIDRVKWVEITSPLKKAYISKKGSEVGYAEELKRLFTNNGGKFDKNGNKILIGHFDYDENNRAYYRTTNYVSNPMLNDTDFDGIQDNEDSNKTRGEFKGSAGDIGKIEYTNDFRNFFVDNYKYNDELSVMSLMIANGKYVDTNQVNVNSIKQYIERLGFKNVLLKENFRISNEETIKGKLYIGKKTIQYRTYESKSDNKGKNSYKDIYGVFLMDFDNEINMKQLVVNFDIDMIETHYDYIARDVERYVDEYMTMYQSNDDYCFWVTGYSIAGGVASHVSPYLIGKGETYTYTFGAPNTTKGGSTANVNVKNIINEDDVIPKILNIKDGYSRVGETYNDSIFDNLQKEYRKLVGSFKNYEAYTKKANTVKRAITNIKSKEATKTLKDKVCKLLSKFLSNFEYIHDGVTMAEYPEIGVYLNPNVKKVKDGHSKKAYYALAKTLNGFDLDNYDVNWTTYEEEISSEEERNNEQRYPEDLLSAIEIVGNWYIQNVPTYETSEEANRTTQTQRDNAEKLRETSWGGIYIYKYDDLGTQTNEYIDERVEELKNNFNNEYPNENLPNDNLTDYLKYGAGDDCVRFGMTVYNYITEGGLFDLHTEILNGSQMPTNEKKGSYLNYGKTILLRDANRFVDSNYELDEWFDNIGYYRIDVDENFDIEDLRPGDFLCCDGGSKSGHVEFYLGYNYVEQVNLETNEVSYERGTAIDRINNSASSGGKAESTYGWGLVSNKIPSYERYGGNEYNWYFYKSADDTSIYRCKGYHECLRKVEGTNKYKFRNVNDNTEFESQCCCTDKRAYNVIYRQNGY